MATTLLLVGAGGFAGRHLRAAAQDAGFDVVATARRGGDVRCDLLDPVSLDRAVAEVTPDAVVNLAGSASVAASFGDPAGAFALNAVGAVALLDAVAKHAPDAHLLCVSSGEVYGDLPESDLPATEELPTRPASPYAASKVAMETACDLYARTAGLRIAVVRAFNHTGPGQSDAFAASSFARQIAEAERDGEVEATLRTGNLEAVRDFSDVRDIVRAYLAVIESRLTGTFNACSGRGVPVGELTEMLGAASSLPLRLQTDPARVPPSEPPQLYGSPRRLEEATGWRCEISLERTMSDLLDWWRGELAG